MEPFYLIHHSAEHAKIAVMCQSAIEEGARAALINPPKVKKSKKGQELPAASEPIQKMVHQQQLILETKGCHIAEVGPHADEVIDAGGKYAEEYVCSAKQYSHGIIGVVNLGNSLFLFFITGKKQVAVLPGGEHVYLITSVDYLPFDKEKKKLSKEHTRYINAIKNIFNKEGFYFSYNADLTQS